MKNNIDIVDLLERHEAAVRLYIIHETDYYKGRKEAIEDLIISMTYEKNEEDK